MQVVKNDVKIYRHKEYELLREDIDLINRYRVLEFGSEKMIIPSSKINDKFIYFLVKDNNSLVSFGRLIDVDVKLDNKAYSVLGIATIISIIKGRGYGKLIMNSMRGHILELEKTAIGFCHKSQSRFYEECGYGIIPQASERFIYKNLDGNIVPSRHPISDVIYIEGDDGFVKSFLNKKDLIAYTSRGQW